MDSEVVSSGYVVIGPAIEGSLRQAKRHHPFFYQARQQRYHCTEKPSAAHAYEPNGSKQWSFDPTPSLLEFVHSFIQTLSES